MLTFSSIFLIIYSIIAVYSILYKKKLIERKNDLNILLSIIIPFKNEANNLPNLVKSLNNQTFSRNKFEVIFIDDHSTDNSFEILLNLEKFFSYKILKNIEKPGKKFAIKQAINHAKGNIIVTTDSDCQAPPTWLEKIYEYFVNYSPKMLILPVKMQPSHKLFTFNNLQIIEFYALQATTNLTTKINAPIMCNSANLAFEKQIYEEFSSKLKNEILSGDDIFLLLNAKKKYKKSIMYYLDNNVAITTQSPENIKKFFLQRSRWASKLKFYFDPETFIASVIIFFVNIGHLYLLVTMLTFITYSKILLFFTKILIDFLIIQSYIKKINQKQLYKLIPFVSIIYPFYLIFLGFLSIIRSQSKW